MTYSHVSTVCIWNNKVIRGYINCKNFCYFSINENEYYKYSGEILNGYTHGKGTIEYYKYIDNSFHMCDKFTGNFEYGKLDGYGISFSTVRGSKGNTCVQKIYEGNWKDNKRHGEGISYNFYGDKFYEGNWKDNQRRGKGIVYYENGQKFYEGNWKDNECHGKGIEYYKNGQKFYEGNWKDDERHGKGISYYKNGQKKYEGNWKDDQRHGKGIFYRINGSIDSKGRYIQGKWFDETTSFLQKYLETRDSSILKKVTAKEIQGYLEKNFNQTYSSQKRKPFLIQELEKLYQKKKEEIIVEEINYDEFGNEITTQCLGSDGNIYDISSMYYLFERNEDGDYKNIPYKYEKNERVPNFPRMGNGQILKDFEILLN